jgi:hypothetical protein
MMNKIVTVTLSSDAFKPKLPYTIYVNAPMDVIKAYALEFPKVYVIVFYTDYESAIANDWNTALGEKWATRVLSPVWVANTEEMELYTNHFLTLDGDTKDDWEVV